MSGNNNLFGLPALKIRRRSLLVLVLFGIAFFLIVVFEVELPSSNRLQKRNDLKYILFWNNYFDYPYFGLYSRDGQGFFLDAHCPVNTCYITETWTLLPVEQFDAVIFHAYRFKKPSSTWFWRRESLPAVRSARQRYVFTLFESPNNDQNDFSLWNGFFNWTWTYRLDSDIPSPYGRVLPINTSDFYPVLPALTWMTPDNQIDDYYEIISKKTRLVAWLVSHCDTHSKREKYAHLLAENVAVDQFGGCGSKHWPKDNSKGFYRMVNETYKFYLSFENSLCKEYVTEKFFNILKYNVVPIVYGDAQYEKIAPPMSYINVLDYESPKELANYLMYLHQTPVEYAKYFWWKKHYVVSSVKVPQVQSMCKLCELLHADLPDKSYLNLNNWWGTISEGKNICRTPNFKYLL